MSRGSDFALRSVLAFALVHTLQAQADLPRAERKFLEAAAQHSMAEIQAGRLAGRKATNPQAKQLGQQVAEDQEKSYAEVVQLAKAKSIGLPMQPDKDEAGRTAKLEKLSGPEFDRKFVDTVVRDHEDEVKAFQKMAKNARDPDVRAYAGKTLPTLVGHLQMARQVAGTRVTSSRR